MEGVTSKEGRVYIVGAGPGDPDLLTVKAVKVLRMADVVIYDRLIPEKILQMIPERAERIYVGKKTGEPHPTQDEINDLMIEKAREGRTVVRLKGGDPFLFGRGAEEAQALKKAGIKYEVVPGVTSALAAPAYAGIPLTHRRYSSSVVIVTGHEDPKKIRKHVDWERIAGSVDTIVVLMGVKKMKSIVESLIKGGCKSDMPVAIIENGTTRMQRVTVGTLSSIVEDAEKMKVEAPAVIVIGDVVKLREDISWFKDEDYA